MLFVKIRPDIGPKEGVIFRFYEPCVYSPVLIVKNNFYEMLGTGVRFNANYNSGWEFYARYSVNELLLMLSGFESAKNDNQERLFLPLREFTKLGENIAWCPDYRPLAFSYYDHESLNLKMESIDDSDFWNKDICGKDAPGPIDTDTDYEGPDFEFGIERDGTYDDEKYYVVWSVSDIADIKKAISDMINSMW